jgi:hypothetical protein
VDPSCSQGYANAPCPPPPPHFTDGGALPFTGFEWFVVVGFAVACVALGLLLRYSARA